MSIVLRVIILLQQKKDRITFILFTEQEPWRPPSRQTDFTASDRLRLDAHSDYEAVTGSQAYFED